jgi:hypothetical protein
LIDETHFGNHEIYRRKNYASSVRLGSFSAIFVGPQIFVPFLDCWKAFLVPALKKLCHKIAFQSLVFVEGQNGVKQSHEFDQPVTVKRMQVRRSTIISNIEPSSCEFLHDLARVWQSREFQTCGACK